MSLRLSRCRVLLSAVLIVSFVGGPHVATADGVGEAQRRVDAMLNELDDLENQMGQLDEDYGTAQDRKDQLEKEIAVSEAKISELSTKLGGVQETLSKIALDRFTGGDTLQLSPIFSDASTYSRAEQKDALGMVAIDAGETDMDGLQALVDQVSREQTTMQRKQEEATGRIQTLEDKQVQYASLEKTYTAKYAQAKKDLGEAKFQAEQERRAKAARAKRAKSKSTTRSATAPRGSGSGSSGSSSGAVNWPAPSGKAGLAVKAALSQLGVPYKFATAKPGVAFDCSGLTWWAWAQAGVSLPRTSGTQYNGTVHVPADQAQPGDLIFYYNPIGHVGLYLGSGQMVHAPQAGSTVSISVVHWNKVVGVGRPG